MLREVSLVYRKQDGKLMPVEEKDEVLYLAFLKGLEDGQKVEVYMNIQEKNDKSLGQLAKINAMIRRLAEHTGESVDETKKMVKIKAGLYRVTGTARHEFEVLSFAQCSRDQLSLAIQTCMEMGVIVGADL